MSAWSPPTAKSTGDFPHSVSAFGTMARHFRADSVWCVSSWASRSSFHRSKSLSPLSSGVSLIKRRTGSPGMNLTDEVSGGIRGL